MDWTGTSDDPNGYGMLRAAVDSFALQLDDLGLGEAAQWLRTAMSYVGMPTEWMGETARALNRSLLTTNLPASLREDMESAVEAIRTGFRRVGSQPNF